MLGGNTLAGLREMHNKAQVSGGAMRPRVDSHLWNQLWVLEGLCQEGDELRLAVVRLRRRGKHESSRHPVSLKPGDDNMRSRITICSPSMPSQFFDVVHPIAWYRIPLHCHAPILTCAIRSCIMATCCCCANMVCRSRMTSDTSVTLSRFKDSMSSRTPPY